MTSLVSGRVLPNRTSGERDANQPQVRDQTEPALPNATNTFNFGEAEQSAVLPVTEVALPPATSWWRRVGKHPRFMHYNRLIVLVLAVNLVLLATTDRTAAVAADLALANFALAVLIRQQYVVNLLFWLATRAPTSWPLRVRWTLAKVYHFGGLHVGGAIAGSLWFIASVVATTVAGAPVAVLAVSYTLVVLLAGIVATAVPPFRSRHHDVFEERTGSAVGRCSRCSGRRPCCSARASGFSR